MARYVIIMLKTKKRESKAFYFALLSYLGLRPADGSTTTVVVPSFSVDDCLI